MSVDFDGTGDWLKVTTTSILTAPPLTMACWANPDDITVTRCLMSIDDTSGGFNQFSLQIAGAVAGDPVRAVTQNFLTVANADTTSGYSASVWGHFCGIIASSTDRRSFYNGGSKGTNATSVADPPGMDAFSIGDLGVADTLPMAGLIAHAAMWNVALTDAEVSLLAAGSNPMWVRPDKLVFYLPMFDARSPQRDWIGVVPLTVSGNPTTGASDPIIGFPPFMRARAWRKITAGPVTTNLSFSITETGTIALTKQGQFNKSITEISTIGTISTISKNAAISTTSTVAKTLLLQKLIAIASSSTVGMLKSALFNPVITSISTVGKTATVAKSFAISTTSSVAVTITRVILQAFSITVTHTVTFLATFIPATVTAAKEGLFGLIRGVGKIGRGL